MSKETHAAPPVLPQLDPLGLSGGCHTHDYPWAIISPHSFHEVVESFFCEAFLFAH
jgi:hypothetical protein